MLAEVFHLEFSFLQLNIHDPPLFFFCEFYNFLLCWHFGLWLKRNEDQNDRVLRNFPVFARRCRWLKCVGCVMADVGNGFFDKSIGDGRGREWLDMHEGPMLFWGKCYDLAMFNDE